MKRVTIALAISALLVGACGEDDLPRATADDLQGRVALIRRAAEAGRVGIAHARLDRLAQKVAALLERGMIDEGKALEILESADVVGATLRLAPSSSPTESPSPPPEAEEGGGNSGKGKGNGDGNGDDGHGND